MTMGRLADVAHASCKGEAEIEHAVVETLRGCAGALCLQERAGTRNGAHGTVPMYLAVNWSSQAHSERARPWRGNRRSRRHRPARPARGQSRASRASRETGVLAIHRCTMSQRAALVSARACGMRHGLQWRPVSQSYLLRPSALPPAGPLALATLSALARRHFSHQRTLQTRPTLAPHPVPIVRAACLSHGRTVPCADCVRGGHRDGDSGQPAVDRALSRLVLPPG